MAGGAASRKAAEKLGKFGTGRGLCVCVVGLLAAGPLDGEAGPRGFSPLQARPPTSRPVMSGGQF